jgi:hypothetical protein
LALGPAEKKSKKFPSKIKHKEKEKINGEIFQFKREKNFP